MNTIRPLRRRIMPLLARRAQRKAPARLVLMTESNSSSLIRIIRVSRVIPALATRTSTGPASFSSASVKAASTDARAIARPMPRLPPVTSTLRGSAIEFLHQILVRVRAPGTLADYPWVCRILVGLLWRSEKAPARPAAAGVLRHERPAVAAGRPELPDAPLPAVDVHPHRLLPPRGAVHRRAALDHRRLGDGRRGGAAALLRGRHGQRLPLPAQRAAGSRD